MFQSYPHVSEFLYCLGWWSAQCHVHLSDWFCSDWWPFTATNNETHCSLLPWCSAEWMACNWGLIIHHVLLTLTAIHWHRRLSVMMTVSPWAVLSMHCSHWQPFTGTVRLSVMLTVSPWAVLSMHCSHWQPFTGTVRLSVMVTVSPWAVLSMHCSHWQPFTGAVRLSVMVTGSPWAVLSMHCSHWQPFTGPLRQAASWLAPWPPKCDCSPVGPLPIPIELPYVQLIPGDTVM